MCAQAQPKRLAATSKAVYTCWLHKTSLVKSLKYFQCKMSEAKVFCIDNFRIIRFSGRNSTGGLHSKKCCIQVEICFQIPPQKVKTGAKQIILFVIKQMEEDQHLTSLSGAQATATRMTWEQNQCHRHLLLYVKDIVPLQENAPQKSGGSVVFKLSCYHMWCDHDPNFVFTLLHLLTLLEAENMEN